VRRAAAAAHSLARAPRRGAAAPMRQRWMSPRMRMPSGSVRDTPPTMASSSAFFTSSWPKISGARLPARRSNTSPPATTACAPPPRGRVGACPWVIASAGGPQGRAGALRGGAGRRCGGRRAAASWLLPTASPKVLQGLCISATVRAKGDTGARARLPAPAALEAQELCHGMRTCTTAPSRLGRCGVVTSAAKSAQQAASMLCMAGRAHVDLRMQLIGAGDRRIAPLLLRHDGGLRQQPRRSAACGSLGPERARSTPPRLTRRHPEAFAVEAAAAMLAGCWRRPWRRQSRPRAPRVGAGGRRARACRKTLVSSPARMARKPVKGSGRKTPLTVTASPGLAPRVSSPRRCTVSDRGVAPCGTCGPARAPTWRRLCIRSLSLWRAWPARWRPSAVTHTA